MDISSLSHPGENILPHPCFKRHRNPKIRDSFLAPVPPRAWIRHVAQIEADNRRWHRWRDADNYESGRKGMARWVGKNTGIKKGPRG